MVKLIGTQRKGKNVLLRFFAAMILLVWIGQMLPPLAALAADESCQLSCCQGLTRHATGSCESGDCHLHTKKRLQPPELICGAAELGKKSAPANGKYRNLFADNRLSGVPIFDETKRDSHDDATNLPFLQTAVLEQLCQTVCCGACNSHNLSQQNQRAGIRPALCSFAESPRPPTTIGIEFSTSVTVKLSQIISRRRPARAPPQSFS